MTEEQRDRLNRIDDPYSREVLRRVFERAADPANILPQPRAVTVARRLDPAMQAEFDRFKRLFGPDAG